MEGEQSIPLWTPDGSQLVFASLAKGTASVLSINADGSGNAATLVTSNARGFPSAWTPDGSGLLAFFLNGQSRLIPRDGKTEPRRLAISSIAQADFSPDGRWLAYESRSNVNEVGQVYVHNYPRLDHREQVSSVNGTAPAWRRDGREMYYVEDASAGGLGRIRMMAVPITTTPTFSAGTPRMLFEGPFRTDGPFRGYDVTPDGQRFLMVQEIAQAPAHVSQMVLVQNWTEELKRVRTGNSPK
jgi:Tol biopolymer transport system component